MSVSQEYLTPYKENEMVILCVPRYGFLQWDLSSHYVEKFYQQWRKCVKKNLQNFKCNTLQLITPDMYRFASRESVV